MSNQSIQTIRGTFPCFRPFPVPDSPETAGPLPCTKSDPLPAEKKILCKFTRISRSAPAIQPENEVDKNAPAMEELNDTISQMLQKTGLSGIYTEWGTKAVILLGILLVTYAATKIFRHLVIPALQTISSQTKATWDDHLFNDRVLHGVCRLLPPVMWYMLLPLAFPDMPELSGRRLAPVHQPAAEHAVRNIEPPRNLEGPAAQGNLPDDQTGGRLHRGHPYPQHAHR